jgi:hypothetical protein
MTVESVYCAICGEKTPLDVDHVKLEAETKRMRDRNDLDEYVFCMDCAIQKFDEWTDPV